MNKKISSIIFSLIIMINMLPTNVFANGTEFLLPEELRETKGAISIEAYNIGQGFLLEPSLFDKEGKSAGDITVDILERKNISYKGATSYFSGMEFDDTAEAEYPSYLDDYKTEFESTGDGDGYLSEFDYSMNAGWCYTINDWWASCGADSSYPGQTITDYNTGEAVILGDVIRWHFTVCGYGADCGFPSNVMAEWTGGNLFTQEDKSDIIFLLAAINDYYGNLDTDDVYETALEVAANPLAAIDEISEQESILKNYIESTYPGTEIETKITKCDEENVYFDFSEEGIGLIMIFADYEANRINMIKPIPIVTEKTDGKNSMFIPVPDGIELSSGDKIMLWENFTSCIPACEAYVFNDCSADK